MIEISTLFNCNFFCPFQWTSCAENSCTYKHYTLYLKTLLHFCLRIMSGEQTEALARESGWFSRVSRLEGAARHVSALSAVFMLQMRGLDLRPLCVLLRPRGPELVFFSASHPVITITVKCNYKCHQRYNDAICLHQQKLTN